MKQHIAEHGFLPQQDPQRIFDYGSELTVLDELGRDLPSLLEDPGFRKFARELKIPPWPYARVDPETLPALRLYYVRVGFLASAYVNQVGQPRDPPSAVYCSTAVCGLCPSPTPADSQLRRLRPV